MNKRTITIFLAFLITVIASGQSFKDIYEKSIHDNTKVSYPHLREADVVWSKKIWRVIDLREKMNHMLFYPIRPTIDGRQNLISIILEEVESGRVEAFDVQDMNVSVTYEDIEVSLGAGPQTIDVYDEITGDVIGDSVVYATIDDKLQDVKQYMIHEEWFFDKKHSTLGVRIIAICPITVELSSITGRMERQRLFWVLYDDIRDSFATHEVFNPANDAHRLSFDDLFMQRRFSSVIYAESNVYDDRFINEYMIGRNAIFEAERIHNEIRNFEHDLWEY